MRLLFRRTFSCAHLYHQAKWTQEQNAKEFGKCFTDFGHGHDYMLEIEVSGENMIGISSCIQKVIDRIDHQHLNFVIPEFKTQVPTTENLSLYLHSQISTELKSLKSSTHIHSLKLNENPEIWVEL